MVREVHLTQGYVALVDDADYEAVSQWSWCVSRGKKTKYARRAASKADIRAGLPVEVSLHRWLMGATSAQIVDHVDRDGLNCQRSNMRFATRAQNAANAIRLPSGCGYRGVHWKRKKSHWYARIRCEGLYYFAYGHSSPEAAAAAYDRLAREHHGEFAVLNFPDRKAA